MLHFENPFAFLLLLILPLFYVLRMAGFLSHITFPLTLSDWGGKTFNFKSKSARFARFLSHIMSVIAFICVVIAFSEPIVTRQEKVFTSLGTEIIFVIDTSPSMAAKDMQESNRLNAAKDSITHLIKQQPGASFGLVSMAEESALVVPSTIDYDLFLNRLQNLVIGEMGDGTAIGTGLSNAIFHLSASRSPKKAIVLITDGENNAGSIHPNTAAILAKEEDINLYIIGLGTKGTVPVEYVNPITGEFFSGYLESSFDEAELARLASLGGGFYFNASDTDMLSMALQNISAKQNVVQSFRMNNIDEPLYSDFLFVATTLILLYWVIRRLYLKELI